MWRNCQNVGLCAQSIQNPELLLRTPAQKGMRCGITFGTWCRWGQAPCMHENMWILRSELLKKTMKTHARGLVPDNHLQQSDVPGNTHEHKTSASLTDSCKRRTSAASPFNGRNRSLHSARVSQSSLCIENSSGYQHIWFSSFVVSRLSPLGEIVPYPVCFLHSHSISLLLARDLGKKMSCRWPSICLATPCVWSRQTCSFPQYLRFWRMFWHPCKKFWIPACSSEQLPLAKPFPLLGLCLTPLF